MARKRKKKNEMVPLNFSFDEGYVFYNRLNDGSDQDRLKKYWKQLYQTAMSEFNSSVYIYENLDSRNISQALIAQGKAEQQKERQFLNEIFGIPLAQNIPIEQYPEYINKINQLIGLKDNYENLIKLIQQGRISKKGNKSNNAKARAFTAETFFESYFQSALRARFDNFFNTKRCEKIIASDNVTAWNSAVSELMELSIEDAIKKMAAQTDKVDGKEVQIWGSALNLLKISEQQFSQLKSEIFKRYNLNQVSKDILEWQRERVKKNIKSTKGLSKKIKSSIGLSERGFRSVNGIINEFASSLNGNYLITESGTHTASKTVLKSNITKTDSVTLYSAAARLNLDSLGEILNNNMNNSDNLSEANQIIENFYNSYMSKLKDTFVVYESTKAYSLGKNFRGFHGGGAQPLSSLPGYLNSIGSKIDGESLVNVLYNTINGAIGHDRQADIKQKVSLALSKHMADFLFDDWQMIGVTTNKAIHMFKLDSIQVPLSYLLLATGKAMNEVIEHSDQYFKISFTLPGQILYPDPINPFDASKGMKGYWSEQRQDVINSSNFSVRFLSNFNSIISKLGNAL